MFCHNCGTKLDDGSLFCSECGARQLDTVCQNTEAQAAAPKEYIETGGGGGAYDGDGGQPKKDNRLILIIILVIVLGILVGVGMFFFSRNSSSSEAVDSDTQTASSMNDGGKKQDRDKGREDTDKDDSDEGDSKDDAAGSTDRGDDKDEDSGSKEETDDKTNDEEKPAEKTYIHEYTVIQGMQTWTDAKAYCEAQGGHLATAVTQEEYDQIVAKANETGCLVLWLGAQRSLESGAFEWVTGEEFAYNAWAAGEPNNDGGSENYLGMMKVNGIWNMYDMPGDVSQYYSFNKVGFVMEKDIEQ